MKQNSEDGNNSEHPPSIDPAAWEEMTKLKDPEPRTKPVSGLPALTKLAEKLPTTDEQPALTSEPEVASGAFHQWKLPGGGQVALKKTKGDQVEAIFWKEISTEGERTQITHKCSDFTKVVNSALVEYFDARRKAIQNDL